MIEFLKSVYRAVAFDFVYRQISLVIFLICMLGMMVNTSFDTAARVAIKNDFQRQKIENLENEKTGLLKEIADLKNEIKKFENTEQESLLMALLYKQANYEKRCFYNEYSKCFEISAGKLENFNLCLSHSCARLEMLQPKN